MGSLQKLPKDMHAGTGRSKKHLENAATLRAAMELEEEELSPDEEAQEDSADGAESPAHGTEEERERATDANSSEASAAAEDGCDNMGQEAQQNGHRTEDRGGRAFDGKAGHDRWTAADTAGPPEDHIGVSEGQSRSGDDASSSSEQEEASDSEGSLDEDAMLARMLQAHARVRRPKARRGSSTHAGADKEKFLHPAAEGDPPGPESASYLPSEQKTGPGGDSSAVNEPESQGAGDEPESGPMLGGTSQTALPVQAKPEAPARRAAAAAERRIPGAADRKPKSKKDRRKAQEAAAAEQGLLCSVCKVQFESRNQLFKHIAEKGHAQRK